TYLGGGSAQATDARGNSLGTITLAQTGFLDIVTANKLGDDLNPLALAVLDNHAQDIKNFVNTGGGLYAEHEESGFGTGNTAAPYGWLTTVFPGLQVVQSGGGTNGLKITPAGMMI